MINRVLDYEVKSSTLISGFQQMGYMRSTLGFKTERSYLQNS